MAFEDSEKDIINAEHYPRTFAYVERFRQAIKARQEHIGLPEKLSADEAIARILDSGLYEQPHPGVDPKDPLRLKKGQAVEIFPIDSGFTHHDKGELASIGVKEVAIFTRPNEGEGILRLHFPRVNFRIQPTEEYKL
jgi:hypothetical protein